MRRVHFAPCAGTGPPVWRLAGPRNLGATNFPSEHREVQVFERSGRLRCELDLWGRASSLTQRLGPAVQEVQVTASSEVVTSIGGLDDSWLSR